MLSITPALLAIWSAPFYAALIGAEAVVSNWHHGKAYSIRGVFENVLLTALNASLDLLMRAPSIWLLALLYDWRWLEVTHGWMYWLTLVFLLDFLFYVLHVVDHYCRLFWAVHVTHHSSEEFNLTVGFRSSVFQPLYRFLYFIPLPLLGFRPEDILLVFAACQIYGVILHTKLVGRLGILEWFLVTPSHHRVHHGSNPEYIDKNMGMVFIIWDRLFGTFQEEQAVVMYGVTKPPRNRQPQELVFHEWRNLVEDVRKTNSWKDAVRVILGKP